jgi:hypothetical protein
MALSGIYVRGKETTFTRDPSHTTLEQTGRLGPPEVAHQRGQQVPAPSNALLGSSHPSHACCHCLCLSIHVILLLARKSAVGLPAIMSCIVDGLVSPRPLTTPRRFFGPSSVFFLCVICNSSWCPVPYLRSQCPRHLEAPVPTATCCSTVARPTVWTALVFFLGPWFGLPPAVSVYARMGERSVRRRAWMVFGRPCPPRDTRHAGTEPQHGRPPP